MKSATFLIATPTPVWPQQTFKITCLALYLFACSIHSFGQRLVIPLINKNGNSGVYSNFIPTLKIKVSDIYTLKDTTHYTAWELRELTFERAQRLKEDVLNGRITNTSFIDYTTRYKVDTAYVSTKKIPRNNVYAMIGTDSQDKMYATVDINNNLTFKDDSTYIIDLKNPVKSRPVVTITFDYFDKSQLRTAKVPYAIDVYDRVMYDGKEPAGLSLTFINQSYKEGFTTIDGKNT